MIVDSIDKTQFLLDNKSYFHNKKNEASNETTLILETENDIRIYEEYVEIESNIYKISETEAESLLGWISANTDLDFNFYKSRFLEYPFDPPIETLNLYKNEDLIDKSLRCLEYSQIPNFCSCGNELKNFAKLHVKIIVFPFALQTMLELQVKDVLCLECSNPDLKRSESDIEEIEENEKYWDYIEKDFILTYSLSQTSTSVRCPLPGKSFMDITEECVVLDDLEYTNRRWFSKNKHDYNISWGRIREILLNYCKNRCSMCGRSNDEIDNPLELHHITKFQDTIKKENSLHFENLTPVCSQCHKNVESKATIKEMKAQLPLYVKYIKQDSSLDLDRDTLIEVASGTRFSKEELKRYKNRVIGSDCEILD